MFSTSLETSFRLEKLISYHHHLFAANPCTSRTVRKEFKCSGEGPGDAAAAAFSNGGWTGSLTLAVQARVLGDLDGAMCGNMLGIFSRKSCRARCGYTV